ncbi:hypothetical protein C6568_01765 [Melaminivora suipulveris]|uniref:Methyltransferase n=1 Tax=Melaminivora suipulveris TaxID=2109913 RepID=A0A2R3Q8M3_9BURK|nr:hypothetical protein [Melaminivora suipulveris]AVO48123.1 hypothetical protein C6568_01765 [Melaminivora suipulveris]
MKGENMAQTFNTVRKYGARVGTGALALIGSGVALAQEGGGAGGNAGAQILTKVNEAMSAGEQIAVAVVLGLFAMWAIKLLWRGK